MGATSDHIGNILGFDVGLGFPLCFKYGPFASLRGSAVWAPVLYAVGNGLILGFWGYRIREEARSGPCYRDCTQTFQKPLIQECSSNHIGILMVV